MVNLENNYYEASTYLEIQCEMRNADLFLRNKEMTDIKFIILILNAESVAQMSHMAYSASSEYVYIKVKCDEIGFQRRSVYKARILTSDWLF